MEFFQHGIGKGFLEPLVLWVKSPFLVTLYAKRRQTLRMREKNREREGESSWETFLCIKCYLIS
jgi:hypothetical protein